MFRKPNPRLMNLCAELIDDTSAMAQELSKRGVKYSHTELLNLAGHVMLSEQLRMMNHQLSLLAADKVKENLPHSMLNTFDDRDEEMED